MWSADRHPRGDFWSWTDRAEVRSAEVIGRHSDLTIWARYAPQVSGPSEHKEHFCTTSQRLWPSFRDAHRSFLEEMAAPLRDANGQWRAHQRNLRGRAALEPSHMVGETRPSEPELGRKCVARSQWSAKRARSHLTLSRLDSTTSDN